MSQIAAGLLDRLLFAVYGAHHRLGYSPQSLPPFSLPPSLHRAVRKARDKAVVNICFVNDHMVRPPPPSAAHVTRPSFSSLYLNHPSLFSDLFHFHAALGLVRRYDSACAACVRIKRTFLYLALRGTVYPQRLTAAKGSCASRHGYRILLLNSSFDSINVGVSKNY